MTGCLKVAKNSIFTGVNNVVVNTVLNTQTKFTSIIGFNKEETKKVLEDYNLREYEGMVKENYDGYRFYNEEMFCPWDVINFVAENYEHKLNGTESDIKQGNYWNATSSSKILQEYLGYLNKTIREKLQDLVDGNLDFAFKDDSGKTAVIIEIKSCASTDELLNAQKNALEQIKEKKYAESYIKDSSIRHVYTYGIAFSNKYCRVKVENLK